MAHQVIKQLDGKYAVWSTIVDNFLIKDLDKNDVINYLLSGYMDDAKTRIINLVERISSGELLPNYITWEEANSFLEDTKRFK